MNDADAFGLALGFAVFLIGLGIVGVAVLLAYAMSWTDGFAPPDFTESEFHPRDGAEPKE